MNNRIKRMKRKIENKREKKGRMTKRQDKALLRRLEEDK